MILYGIHYSPWSLRARWALRHHGVDYDYREYLPMVSTPLLRLKLRDFTAPVTVPILIDGSTILRDSVDIAKHADKQGSGEPLFGDAPDVLDTWTTTANQIAEAGRAITTFCVLDSPDATRENVPPFVPRPLRPLATPIVDLGAWYLGRKYVFDQSQIDEAHVRIRTALERVANRLAVSDSLGERFGWPDIAVSSALQFVRPADDWARLGKASRDCWTRHALSEEFDDVLKWRDAMLQNHRS